MTTEKRNVKKTKRATVVRRSGEQSVVVRVDRRVKHPQFKKYVQRRTHIHVHDPENKCHVGDDVMIRESRPISKTKRWAYVSTITAAAAATKGNQTPASTASVSGE